MKELKKAGTALVDKISLKNFTITDIARHTYASFLYQGTHDIIFVSKKLRHSDPAFTASVYVDIMEEYEKNIDKSFKV